MIMIIDNSDCNVDRFSRNFKLSITCSQLTKSRDFRPKFAVDCPLKDVTTGIAKLHRIFPTRNYVGEQ